MKIVCIGGGPGALYFAISMKVRDAGHDITVLERGPRGSTYGWGVVYWDDLLDLLYGNDPESARAIRAVSTLWRDQEVRLNGEDTAHLGGYGYSAGRAALLEVLTRRAEDLDVDVQHDHEVTDPSEFADADLIVACDGANSKIRQAHARAFGTRVRTGRNPYIWLGTDRVFDSFVFDFEETPAGWIWFHAYPSSAGISTCIVECTERTWRRLEFDGRGEDDGLRLLEKIFYRALDGHSLISRARGDAARWLRFTEISNTSWYHENLVLLGDAAHTTHFTIGSGTRLAMIDAMALAEYLYDEENRTRALANYDQDRRRSLRRTQASARTSMAWFEHMDRHARPRTATDLAYAMTTRGGGSAPWSYQLFRGAQLPAVRKMQRRVDDAARWLGARRRGEPIRSVGAPSLATRGAAADS
jgi:2-polyprenyl-6-methoxyphenol hydroxylase-like FAD-dependent oxidoreductase